MITHPYNKSESVPLDTRILIVGTAPPPRFDEPKNLRGNDFDFFYGSEDNYMWQYFDEIAEDIDGACLFNRTEVVTNGKKKIIFTDTSDDCSRIARSFLRKHQLWMKDVLERYERKEGMGHLASDEAIIEPGPSDRADFVSLFNAASTINTLAFTSKKAATWTLDRLGGQLRDESFGEPIRRIEVQKQRGEFWDGNVLGCHVRFILLPSPSGRAAVPKIDVEIYKKFLFGR